MKRIWIGCICLMLLCACLACAKGADGGQGTENGGLGSIFSGGKTDGEAETAATPRPTWEPTPEPVVQEGELNEMLLDKDGVTVRIVKYAFSSETGIHCSLEMQNHTDSDKGFCVVIASVNGWNGYPGERNVTFTGGYSGEYVNNWIVFLRPNETMQYELNYRLTTDTAFTERFPVDTLHRFSIYCSATDPATNNYSYAVGDEYVCIVSSEKPTLDMSGTELYSKNGLKLVSKGYDPERKRLYLAAENIDPEAMSDAYLPITAVVNGFIGRDSKYSIVLKSGEHEAITVDLFPMLKQLSAEQPASLELYIEESGDRFLPISVSVPEGAAQSFSLDALPVVFENESVRIRKIGLFGPHSILLAMENLTESAINAAFDWQLTGQVDGDTREISITDPGQILPGTNALIMLVVYERDAYEVLTETEIVNADRVTFTIGANYSAYDRRDETPPMEPTQITVDLSE